MDLHIQCRVECGESASMTLLQGAFNKNSFVKKVTFRKVTRPGKFRSILDEKTVKGPLVVTKTVEDMALGRW
jgi:hypothetical protein